MDYQLGLLGLLEFIYTKVLSKKQLSNDGITKKEMEDFCDKTAKKYGVTRGINLLDMQHSIANPGYVDEEVAMKNEDAVKFLENEREELLRRKEAMFVRMSVLPVDVVFDENKEYMQKIKSVFSGNGSKEGKGRNIGFKVFIGIMIAYAAVCFIGIFGYYVNFLVSRKWQ